VFRNSFVFGRQFLQLNKVNLIIHTYPIEFVTSRSVAGLTHGGNLEFKGAKTLFRRSAAPSEDGAYRSFRGSIASSTTRKFPGTRGRSRGRVHVSAVLVEYVSSVWWKSHRVGTPSGLGFSIDTKQHFHLNELGVSATSGCWVSLQWCSWTPALVVRLLYSNPER
jgi:hypothetical protein